MIVLVCGGRDYANFNTVKIALDAIHAEHGISCIVTGCAGGADKWARNWALGNQVDVHVFAARWSADGRKAGPMRNQRMLSEAGPDLVVAFPGGRGTADMVRRAHSSSVRVKEITR